ISERVAERRVLEGRFGCPNCRENFVVAGGFADLRPAGTESEPDPEPLTPTDGREAAIRLAALMGLGGGPPRGPLSGPEAAHARAPAGPMGGVGGAVVGAAPARLGGEGGGGGFAAAGRLPFGARCMGGVTLSGPAADAFLEEGARVLSGAGRIVVEGAPEGCEARLADAGLEIVAREGGTVVARRK